ncbi:hypothetical protein BDZ97DRAFT_1927723 [Flammula alnicola]|nr:hypothetical protein BDZ97DRAFT_1927723 [Flammula alnicola]
MSSGMFETSTTDRRVAGPSLPANRVTLGKRRITINDGSTSLIVNFLHHPTILPRLSGLSRPLEDFNKGWCGTIRTRPTTTSHAPPLVDGWADLGRMQRETRPAKEETTQSPLSTSNVVWVYQTAFEFILATFEPRRPVVSAPQSRLRIQREGIRGEGEVRDHRAWARTPEG